MAITVITGPALEPLTTAEARDQARVDITEDDALIDAYEIAARRLVEQIARRALVTQTLELTLDAWPTNSVIVLPRPPLASVTSVKYYEDDDTEHTLSATAYYVDTDSEPGRVVLRTDETWPDTTLRVANGVKIRYVAGYGDPEDVPETYKQAIRLLLGHWYENREEAVLTGAQPKGIPFGVHALLSIDRDLRY